MTALAYPAQSPLASLDKLRHRILAWPSSQRTYWTWSQVKASLRAFREGDFSLIGPLADELLNDDEIPGALETRIDSVLASAFALKVHGRDKLKPRERDALELWPDMAPDDEVYDFQLDRLLLGAGIGTIDWDTTGPIWIPRFRALPAEFLHYDSTARLWQYHTRDGLVDVTPGDGKWVLSTQGQRGWLKGLIRALAPLWLTKQKVLGDWERYCQKHGLPIIKAKTPIYRDEKEKQRFVDDIAELQSEGIIGLPQEQDGFGYDVELLEPTTVSWQTFQNSLERSDRKIQILITGANAQTEAVGAAANRSVATEHGKAVTKKARKDAKDISNAFHRQLLTPFFNLNYGADAQVPYPCWTVAPEEDVKSWENSRLQFSSMVKTLKEANYRITNLEHVAGELGLEIEEVPLSERAAEVEALAPPEPDPAPAAPAKKAPAKK